MHLVGKVKSCFGYQARLLMAVMILWSYWRPDQRLSFRSTPPTPFPENAAELFLGHVAPFSPITLPIDVIEFFWHSFQGKTAHAFSWGFYAQL